MSTEAAAAGRPALAGSSGRTVASAGWPLVIAALTLVGYLLVAVTVGAGFERDLQSAADREGVALNAVSTPAQARVTHDHALYAVLVAAFLLVPPALLLVAATRIRRATGGALGAAARWTAVASLVLWWGYVGLGLGLLADPDDLPPLVRDFGPLTVPVVTTLSLLALVSLALVCESVRGAGVARRAARVGTVLCLVLGGLGVLGLVSSGAADPVPPLVVVPGALVVGIALLRAGRRGQPGQPREL